LSKKIPAGRQEKGWGKRKYNGTSPGGGPISLKKGARLRQPHRTPETWQGKGEGPADEKGQGERNGNAGLIAEKKD